MMLPKYLKCSQWPPLTRPPCRSMVRGAPHSPWLLLSRSTPSHLASGLASFNSAGASNNSLTLKHLNKPCCCLNAYCAFTFVGSLLCSYKYWSLCEGSSICVLVYYKGIYFPTSKNRSESCPFPPTILKPSILVSWPFCGYLSSLSYAPISKLFVLIGAYSCEQYSQGPINLSRGSLRVTQALSVSSLLNDSFT
jgi:hypothetical protein